MCAGGMAIHQYKQNWCLQWARTAVVTEFTVFTVCTEFTVITVLIVFYIVYIV